MQRVEWERLPGPAQVALRDFLQVERQLALQRLQEAEEYPAVLRHQGVAQFLTRQLSEIEGFARPVADPEKTGRTPRTGY